jgi:peptidoglycan/LPS O-acetylase OafA/YrhL
MLFSVNLAILATMMFLVSLILSLVTVSAEGISLEAFGVVITGVIFTFLIFLPLLGLELLLLVWLLKLLSQRLSRRGKRVAAVIGAISMGTPFYLLEMGEWRFAFGLAILLAAFGFLMIVPAGRHRLREALSGAPTG